MNILGVELEFDFFDADQVEIYERENQRVVETIKEPTKYEGKSTADAFRIQCAIVNTFFDNVFGVGTAQRIFKGKNNIKDHMEAFAIVADAAMNTRKEFDAMSDKYSPNRAERRRQEQQNSRNFNRNNAAYHGKGKNHGK